MSKDNFLPKIVPGDFSLKRDPDYYKNIKMQFGIELEICIRLSPQCLIRKGDLTRDLEHVSLKEKFDMYFENILVKAPLASRQLFPRIALNTEGNIYVYNLLEPFNHNGLPNVSLVTNYEEREKIYNYEIPQFEEDVTVICGDSMSDYLNGPFSNATVVNRNLGTRIVKNKSIAFECISPKLSITGIPNDQNISESLLPYLNLIGLNNPDCFMTNKSSGLHVNISAIDILENTLIPITKYPLFLFILDEYISKERNYYNTEFRIDTSMWSKPVYRMINQLSELNLPKDMTTKNIYDLFTDYRKAKEFNKSRKNPSNSGYPTTTYLKNKEYGLKIKNNDILEFRVFRSEKKIQKILDNTLYAMVIVMRGILFYWDKLPVKGGYKKTRSKRIKKIIRNTTKHRKN
jgi:hypothetical protein